jgi:hypothetical protein
MSALYQSSLKQRISVLTEELVRLQIKRDLALDRRASTPEQKQQRLAAFLKVSEQLRHTEHRLHYAKRRWRMHKETSMYFMLRSQWPNNALEPTAVGAFTLMSTDNITSPTSVTPLSTAVAQLGR